MEFGGPHFDPSLIGPDGRLARLHKGAKASYQPTPAPPAVPRESDAMEGALQMQEDIRRKRRSLAGSFLGGVNNGGGGGQSGNSFLGA